MITLFRSYLEDLLDFPIHYVNVIDPTVFPIGSVALKRMETGHTTSNEVSTRREIDVLITLYHTDYEALDSISELIVDTYDGQSIQVVGTDGYRCYLEDMDDDSFPPFDGSNDWIYCRLITLKISYKKQ